MTSLCVENLSYAYGSKQALDDVSLRVDPGQFCALLGPNGAGKSTLFSLLTRLFTTPTGRITIAGHDLGQNPNAALAKIGVVFQQTTLDLDLTVYRNLTYFAALHGLSGRAAHRQIDAALERLNMSDRKNDPARSLNGGHRRRLEIARCLIHQPLVLLLDEPTVGLDASARKAITDHVHDLSKQDGLAVLWATHLTDEIRDSDRLLILHQGRILEDGTTQVLRGANPLTEHFLARTGTPA